MFQKSNALSWFASNKLSQNEFTMQTDIRTPKQRRSKALLGRLATWVTGLAVMASGVAVMADVGPQKVKPTLVVITPGFQAGGREMPQDWIDPLADKVEGQLTKYGSQTETLKVGWNTHAPNGDPADHIANSVRDFLEKQNEEWDVLFIGHSRGAVLNNKALSKLGSPRNLGYLEQIMLDPTAAHFAGDQYPKEVPPRVNHAINYDDNHRLAGGLTKGGEPIKNADNVNIGLGHNTDVGAHTSIQKFWTENRAEQDIGEFLSKKDNRPKESLQANTTPAPKSRKTLSAPVDRKNQWVDESGRAVGDVIRTGRIGVDDLTRQKSRLEKDLVREADGLNDHFRDAVANPGNAAVAGRDRVLAGALHARDMAASGRKSIGNAISSGRKSAETVISSGAMAAGSAISTNAKNAGGVISREAKSAGGYLSNGGKSAGGMVSSGAKTTGGAISREAKSAGGYVSNRGKSVGGMVSSGAKTTGGVISSEAKSAGGYVSSGAKSTGAAVSSGAKKAGGKISSGFKGMFGR